MGRVDLDEVLVAEDDVVERIGTSPGRPAAHARPPSRSVRPTEPTSSEPPVNISDRLVRPGRVGDGVDDVLRGVTRRVERGEPQPADLERLAVADGPMRHAQLGAGADDVLGPGRRDELAAARHVVVVEMGLDRRG